MRLEFLVWTKEGLVNKSTETYYEILNLAKDVSKVTDKEFSVLQNVEIVKYPCGACKVFHKDRTRKTTTGSSITYLNDNYIGGHTVIEGVDVQPLSGKQLLTEWNFVMVYQM